MFSEPQVSFFQVRSRERKTRVEIPHHDPLAKPATKVLDSKILKTPVKNPNPMPGILHPRIFVGHNVVVNIHDIGRKQAIEKVLQSIGSNICTDTNPMVDIIVSDRPVRIVPMPITYGSRGKRLAAAIHGQAESYQPLVVLTQQIPWIFTQKQKEEEVPKKSEEAKFKGMVVVDEAHVKRPFFKEITHMPTLYFCDAPRGYTFTPFTQPPPDPALLVQKYESYSKAKEKKQNPSLGPTDNGFCEICGCSFKNAQAHHDSPEHQAKANRESLWEAFDELSNKF